MSKHRVTFPQAARCVENGDIHKGVGGNDHIRHLRSSGRQEPGTRGAPPPPTSRRKGSDTSPATRPWEGGGPQTPMRPRARRHGVRSDVEALVGAEEQSAAVLMDGAPSMRTTAFLVFSIHYKKPSSSRWVIYDPRFVTEKGPICSFSGLPVQPSKNHQKARSESDSAPRYFPTRILTFPLVRARHGRQRGSLRKGVLVPPIWRLRRHHAGHALPA